MWQECVAEEVLHLIVDRKQRERERERERERKEQRPGTTLKGIPPVTYFIH
jgi:hypothetical protein